LYRENKENYAAYFPHASDYILHLEDGEAVGRLLLAREHKAWRVVSIAIAAAHRGKGLASEVMRQCQQDCANTGAELHLRVTQGNPAHRLYERLGFQAVLDDGHAIEMVWRAGSTIEN